MLLIWFGAGCLIGVGFFYCLEFVFELIRAFFDLFTD